MNREEEGVVLLEKVMVDCKRNNLDFLNNLLVNNLVILLIGKSLYKVLYY